jgi:hypothetical protein
MPILQHPKWPSDATHWISLQGFIIFFGFLTTCTFLIGTNQLRFYKIGKILYSFLRVTGDPACQLSHAQGGRAM